MTYRAVLVTKGRGGYGGPLTIKPTPEKPYVGSYTGGGIHPVAAKIAELTGGEAIDVMKKAVKITQLACVIIDCGGGGRCGVYPAKRVPTINLYPIDSRGILMRYMTPDIYVAGVDVKDVSLVEE
jgi:PTS system glucitol/sorbitol-specific IIB component